MAGAHPHLPEDRGPAVAACPREHAFSLVELLVVVVIAMVLLGGIASVMTTGRSSSGRAAAVATARTLGDAIDDFRKDHGGRPPALGSAADWPEPVTAGPQHAFSQRRYLRRGAPDALANGTVGVIGPAGGTTTARWELHYAPSVTGAGGWTITIRDRQRKAPPCSVGGGEVPRLPERAC